MADKIFDFLDFGKENKFHPKPLAHLHTFYISGEIKEPDNYAEMFDMIRNTNENDIVKLHINSSGGHLFTAIQFMRVLAECPAQVVCSVEGACMSAATMIFLSGNSFEISEHSIFMFHNYSSIIMGKGGELYDNIIHERKWSEKILRSSYKDFLTEEEISSILDNKDIWMDGEEVLKRLKKKQEVIEKKIKVKVNNNGTKSRKSSQ